MPKSSIFALQLFFNSGSPTLNRAQKREGLSE
jgi:hypothetical protein